MKNVDLTVRVVIIFSKGRSKRGRGDKLTNSESNNPARTGGGGDKKKVAPANRNFIVRALELGPLAIAGNALNCLHGAWQLWDFFLVIGLIVLILNYETSVRMPTWASRTRIITGSLLVLAFGWFAFLTGRDASPIPSDPTSPDTRVLMPTIITQSGQKNVYASNNQGNFNTGTIDGNLTQISGPHDRKLSEEQLTDLETAIKPFAEEYTLDITAMMGDAESSFLADQIRNAAGSCGMKTGGGWSQFSGFPQGIEVRVRDANPPPPLATALVVHLKGAGFQVNPVFCPEWPVSDNNKVEVFIYFKPRNSP